MDEAEFEKNMESARARISGLSNQPTAPPPLRDDDIVNANSEIPMKKVESVSDLEDKGAAKANKISQEYPYLFANTGLGDATTSLASSSTPPLQALSGFDTAKEPEDEHTTSS
ncbi:BnaC05g32900D [Brassica napus]|uniref:BnaC05g32900D protein n=1 Tax=Brassica napus TaxID=3708 RepID=A0A078GGX4_BRANA|nr:BnaC05g32900D [Brassica napus]